MKATAILANAWAAGFIDADGCIMIRRKRVDGKTYFALRLKVAQHGHELPEGLVRLQSLYGGSVTGPYERKEPNRKPRWFWTAADSVAEHALRQIGRFLLNKRSQGEAALAFRAEAIGRGKRDLQVAYHQRLRDLKQAPDCDCSVSEDWPLSVKNAYAAGLLDGDGCIAITNNRNRGVYTLRVIIAEVGPKMPAAIDFMGHNFIGRYEKPRLRRGKSLWTWYTNSEWAELLLETLQPHVTTKSDQLSVAIEYRQRAVGSPGRRANGLAPFYYQKLRDVRREK